MFCWTVQWKFHIGWEVLVHCKCIQSLFSDFPAWLICLLNSYNVCPVIFTLLASKITHWDGMHLKTKLLYFYRCIIMCYCTLSQCFWLVLGREMCSPMNHHFWQLFPVFSIPSQSFPLYSSPLGPCSLYTLIVLSPSSSFHSS